MEINSAKYLELIRKLEDCIGNYERMSYQYNKHILYLANGDVLNIKVLKNNVPHLLGVKLDYLRLANRFKPTMDKYDELKCFIDQNYPFSKLVTEEKKLNYDSMFSNYVDNKLDIFVDNIKIRTDDMQFIVKYDSEKTYQVEAEADICDYYIVRKIRGNYCLLGIKKNETGDLYLPVTSRKYENHTDFEKFMERIAKKQEITYPYIMKIRNNSQGYNQDFNTRMSERQVFLDKVIKAASKYDATAAVARDYSYALNIFMDEKIKKHNNITLLNLISDSIKNGDILEESTINDICGESGLSDAMLDLINACNDRICGNVSEPNESYSKVCDEKNKLKNELIEAKRIIEEQNNKYNELIEKNESLEQQNQVYSSQMSILDEAFQKVKTIKNEEKTTF